MDLKIESMEPHSFNGFSKFEFKEITKHRKLLIGDVLPQNKSLSYSAIITELFIEKNGKEYNISDFKRFFDICGFEPNWKNLQKARTELNLIEGKKKLSSQITSRLEKSTASSPSLYIRCRPDSASVLVWKVLLERYFAGEDLLNVLPHRFGEFELTDESNTWYLRMADDDPFLFLAGPKALTAELAAACPLHVMPVSGSMIYVL